MNKFIIGLTGTYCSGKNYIADILSDRGLNVLDVDKLGHIVIDNEKTALLKLFGDGILDQDGVIDRKLLGEKVFGKPQMLAALEEIVHPRTTYMVNEWIAGQRDHPCVINAALIHRSSVFNELKAIILVHSPVIIRLLRAKKRDKLPWKELFKRINSQKKYYSQYFTGKADIYRVENWFFTGTFLYKRKKLEGRIDEILSLMGVR